MTDYMDWKQLTLEKADRLKLVGKKWSKAAGCARHIRGPKPHVLLPS